MKNPTETLRISAKTAQGQQTREEILDAANQLFVKRGYHATSMRQIASSAEVSLGNIYNHFASKEEIFTSLFFERHPYHEVIPVLTESIDERVETTVQQAASKMMKTLQDRPGFMHLILIELIEFEAKHMPALVYEVLPILQQVLERIQLASGGLRDIPAYVLLRAFIGLFFSYYITDLLVVRQMPDLAESQENALEQFVDIFLHGILWEA
jgi:AcrR family transcriptional regulator